MGIEVLKGLFLNGKDVTDMEPDEPNIDRELTQKYTERLRGSVRLGAGKYYTKEEWEERRKKLLKLSLP